MSDDQNLIKISKKVLIIKSAVDRIIVQYDANTNADVMLLFTHI